MLRNPHPDARGEVATLSWRGVLVSVLLLASLAEFSFRGPVRAVHATGWNDFLSPYIQAKAWARGQDPYSALTLVSLWPSENPTTVPVDAEAANGTLEMKRGMPTPYPITSLVVIAPFTTLRWPAAWLLWIGLSTAAVVWSAFALLSICGCSPLDVRSQLFLAFMFALAPFHTGLATANPAMLAVSLTVAIVWLTRRGWQTTGGILLAVAVCLKPTVAGGLLLYFVLRRRWKVAGVAIGLAALIGLIGISRMTLAGVPWLASYLANTRRIFAPGSLADFARPDSIRFNMINAQVLFYSLIKSTFLANLLSRVLGVALLGWWLILCFRHPKSEVLEISSIFVLSLIPIYHRFYDAGLLIWPLAWALLMVRKRWAAWSIGALVAPFLVSGPALLSELAHMGRIPPLMARSFWWNAIVIPHEVWSVIFLAVFLLYITSRDLEEKSLPVRPAPLLSSVKQASAL